MTYLLHQLLTESAQRLPENEAVRFEGQCLTYRQLDELTNQVAHTLRAQGMQRGDRVGIFVHKSIASVAAVFGIMKAGGVYVPLDPNAPARRLAYITRNCDIRYVLTAPGKLPILNEFFAEGTPIETVLLLQEQTAEDGLPEATAKIIKFQDILSSEASAVTPDGTIENDLAYILYTSGSTGEPKGVMISHRTIFTFVNWCVDTFGMTQADRVTSHAPLHFDLSTFDIYATIKAGGTIVLVPEKLSIFPVRLVKLLQDERISMTYLVPSILSMMVNYGNIEKHDLSTLRAVLFAGEVFPIKYLRKLVEALPHPDYYNLYGPTETNVCTYYKVQPADLAPERMHPVPIGIACENIEVFAVGEDGKRVDQTGVEGELWVRGSCVAQGYWGDAEKTSRNFVRNVHQPHFEEVAYRTGDIVSLHEDGKNWIYVGRRDHMIKSRGYRIELGEIEAAIYSNENVKEAAVIAIPDEMVGNRIRAFIVPIDGSSLTVKEIEAHCIQRLPRYMVPEAFEFRSDLPKTSTGKINRPELLRQTSG